MPNHVTHRITVKGDPALVAAFQAAHVVKDGDREPAFDFNTVIPMPDILRNSESSSSVDFGIYALTGAYTFGTPLDYPWVRDKGITTREQFLDWATRERPDWIEAGKRALKAKAETGFADWYAWSVHHWGTKWNAYAFDVVENADGEYVFKFDTAWSPPEPIFETLATMHPALSISAVAFDEGWNFAWQFESGAGKPPTSEMIPATADIYEQVYSRTYEPDED